MQIETRGQLHDGKDWLPREKAIRGKSVDLDAASSFVSISLEAKNVWETLNGLVSKAMLQVHRCCFCCYY